MITKSLIKCSRNRCLSSEASIQMLGCLFLKTISSLQISSYMEGDASPSLAPETNAHRCLPNALTWRKRKMDKGPREQLREEKG